MLIKADFRNVADYLAGLGILEASSWHCPEVCGCWNDSGIEIDPMDDRCFSAVVECLAGAKIDIDPMACKEGDAQPKESPLVLTVVNRIIPLNAWLDGLLDRKSIWSPGISGQVAAKMIVEDLLTRIKPLIEKSKPECIFGVEEGFAINDCAQFRYDGRTAWTTLDAGFSPNDSGLKTAARPFVEFFAIIGAQSFFPQAAATKFENPEYCIWQEHLPVSLCRLAARGMLHKHSRRFKAKRLEAGNFGAFSYADEI